jgi:hypothetical protein
LTATAGARWEPLRSWRPGRLTDAVIGGGGAGLSLWLDLQEAAAERQLVGAVAVGEEAVMADTMESGRQNVQEKAAHELVGIERHQLLALVVMPVILPSEGNAVVLEGGQPAVCDGDAMGVAAEIGQDLFRAAERPLGVDDPSALGERSDQTGEGGRLGQMGEFGKELQVAGVEGAAQPLEEQSAEQA